MNSVTLLASKPQCLQLVFVRLLSDRAPNTQLDGYGILAFIQALTNTFLPTESIMQRGVALLEPLHPNNIPQWWKDINKTVQTWWHFRARWRVTVCWTTKSAQQKQVNIQHEPNPSTVSTSSFEAASIFNQAIWQQLASHEWLVC